LIQDVRAAIRGMQNDNLGRIVYASFVMTAAMAADAAKARAAKAWDSQDEMLVARCMQQRQLPRAFVHKLCSDNLLFAPHHLDTQGMATALDWQSGDCQPRRCSEGAGAGGARRETQWSAYLCASFGLALHSLCKPHARTSTEKIDQSHTRRGPNASLAATQRSSLLWSLARLRACILR